MDKTAKWHGGGTEGEEWVACSVKVGVYRLTKGYSTIQGAIDSLV